MIDKPVTKILSPHGGNRRTFTCVCQILRFASADHHVIAGNSSVGDASSVEPGSCGSPYGCAAVPDHGVDVQWQNTSRAHKQAEG